MRGIAWVTEADRADALAACCQRDVMEKNWMNLVAPVLALIGVLVGAWLGAQQAEDQIVVETQRVGVADRSLELEYMRFAVGILSEESDGPLREFAVNILAATSEQLNRDAFLMAGGDMEEMTGGDDGDGSQPQPVPTLAPLLPVDLVPGLQDGSITIPSNVLESITRADISSGG